MTTSAMEQLYQQVILDHARAPHGRGLELVAAGVDVGESFQVNPTCGDEVRLRVALQAVDGESTVESVSWEGQGCSISQASLSMMTDLVRGEDVLAVERRIETFLSLMHAQGAGLGPDLEESLGDAAALAGVAKYPARVKCALLGWMALRDALAKAGIDPEGEK